MVVTRRTPVAPVAPASRTNSSQPIPRVAKGRDAHASQNSSYLSSPLVDGGLKAEFNANADSVDVSKGNQTGTSLSKTSKSKHKSKTKKNGKRKGNKSSSLIDFLSKALLLFFTIYSLSVCPSDKALEKPICRGLSEYRRLVLEPYVFPPIQAAFAHPSVAPYIQRVKPHVHRVVEIVTPVILRTQTEWNARVVPQWNKRVIPRWKKYAIPQIQRLEKTFEPYRIRVEQEYNLRFSSYVKLASYNINRLRRKTQPYIILAASKSYDSYQASKPYAKPLWRKIKAGVRRLLVIAQEKRHQFVDPHVARIWEKVKELSNGTPKVPPTFNDNSAYHPLFASSSAIDVTVASTADATHASSESHVFASIPSDNQTDGPLKSAASIISESLTVASVADALGSTGSPEPTPFGVDAASTLSRTVIDSLSPNAPVTQGTSSSDATQSSSSSSTLASATNDISASTYEGTSVVPLSHPSQVDELSAASTSKSAPTNDFEVPVEEDTLDLDAFYADLGLDVDDTEPTEEAPITPEPEESEEEKAEKLRQKAAAIAEKRANINARHTKWEKQLEELIKSKRKELRKNLVALRKTAVIELGQNAEIRAEIEALVTEAEKYLKGADVYLKNLKKEGRKDEEKVSLWDRVVGKVETKFTERLREVEAVVNQWYMSILQQEMHEVEVASFTVKDIAEKAQADIGLDYAWLDDVTYDDWQRYHDLVRTSENFTAQAQSIQDGSHSSPPINPVLPALNDLQSEVQDIVVGFETRLRRIKRTGERLFRNGEVEKDPDVEDVTPSETHVSILPVPTGDASLESAEEPYIPPVVIGRSQEEVLKALEHVDNEVPVTEVLVSKKDLEEVVDGLLREAEQGEDVETTSASPVVAHSHFEL